MLTEWFFKVMWGTFLLGKVTELLAVLHDVPARAVRKKRIFFLSLTRINLPLQAWDSCGCSVWMLQITQESVCCAGIRFQQGWILFGIFFFYSTTAVLN